MNLAYLVALLGLVAFAEVVLGLLFVAVCSAYITVRNKSEVDQARALRGIDLDHSVALARAMAEISDQRPLGDARRG